VIHQTAQLEQANLSIRHVLNKRVIILILNGNRTRTTSAVENVLVDAAATSRLIKVSGTHVLPA
jgi:hypothetical protein